MKKAIIMLLLFIITINVKASSDLFQDVYIEDDGDVLIKQILNVHGTFNGFEISYDFSYDGEESIYGSDSIEINKVCEIDSNAFEQNIYNPSSCFTKVNSASKGDSKKYVFSNNKLTMYNPSNIMDGKAFYIEFVLKNTVVRYDDIADLKLSIFDYGFNEEINTFKARFHLPGKDSDFRIWGHGPLYGETDRLDDSTGMAQATYIPANTPIYIRVAFNRDLISNSKKTINKDMFQQIILEETEAADEANEKREDYRDIINKKNEEIGNFIKFGIVPWITGLIGFILYDKKKNNKNTSSFQQEYFRDFPDNSSPESVQLLVSNKLDSLGLSSSLLNIIRKKGLTIQEFNATKGLLIKKEVKDYKITLNDSNLKETLTNEELYLRNWFLSSYGDGNTFDLSSLNEKLKSEYAARDFVSRYKDWTKMCKDLFNSYNYFEKNSGTKFLFIAISLIPLIGSLLFQPALIGLAVILAVPGITYSQTTKKRTSIGNEKYFMWKALKNFMSDFGRFNEKELPEIHLWEKYLVYANVFGIADKVRKQMEIKIQNFEPDFYNSNRDMLDYILINNMINNSIGSSVSKAYSTAQSTISRAAASRDSSGGGFGGGFSGGGSFGGGGGMSGGRF